MSAFIPQRRGAFCVWSPVFWVEKTPVITSQPRGPVLWCGVDRGAALAPWTKCCDGDVDRVSRECPGGPLPGLVAGSCSFPSS